MPLQGNITVTNNEASPYLLPTPTVTPATADTGVGPFNPPGDPYPDVTTADQQSVNYYTDYRSAVRYEIHPGTAVQPLAGPPQADGTTCEAVQLTAEYMTKVVEWTAERFGAAPKVPDWNTSDPNLVLTYASITDAVPLPGPNALRVWRVSGRYVYRLLKPLDPNQPWPTAADPADTTPAAQNAFTPGQKDATLLG